MPTAASVQAGATNDGIASVVENILEHRKQFRKSYFLSRMYKTPFMKEKRKRVREEKPLEDHR